MSISLKGLLSFQAYWILDSYQEKKGELERDVQKALAHLEDAIENEEALVFIKGDRDHFIHDSLKSEDDSFEYIADFSYEKDEDSVLKDVKTTYRFKASKGFEGGMMIVDDDIKEVDVINLRDSVRSHITLVQRFKEKKFELSEAINQIAIEFAFKERTFQDRIASLSFDSLLENSLKKEGLDNLAYQFSLEDLSNDSIVLNDLNESSPKGKLNFDRLILVDDTSKGGLLKLYIGDSSAYLLKSILPILAVSILLSLLLLFTFFFTLKKIFLQKKLSEMKTDFINNMTHEFKTPIATISLAVDSIFHPEILGKEGELRKLGGIIKKENERMHKQVERLLQTALFEKGKVNFKKEVVSVHELLNEIKDIYSIGPAKEKQIEIEMQLEADRDKIIADRLHLFNALRNIVDNAIKFSLEKAEIKISSSSKDGKLTIEIADKGIGMSKSTMAHIFDSFYRHTEGDLHTTKGFGLGLAYVKEVIENLSAKISVDSELHAGSCFTLEFDLSNEA